MKDFLINQAICNLEHKTFSGKKGGGDLVCNFDINPISTKKGGTKCEFNDIAKMIHWREELGTSAYSKKRFHGGNLTLDLLPR